jgi:hypothetical protein
MRAWTILACVLLGPVAAADTVLQAWAYVNLTDVPPRQVSRDGSPVSSSAAGDGSSASARASETSVSSRADSSDGHLTTGASATASTSTTFKVTGGHGGSVPLTFNLGVSGSINANSFLVPVNVNVGVAEVSLRSNIDLSEANGSILLGSQNGVLVIHSAAGTFGAGGSAEGVVVDDVEVHLADPLDLGVVPFKLMKFLGFYHLTGPLAEVLVELDDLISSIKTTAKLLGFPDLDIPPGKVVPVYIDTFTIHNNVPITVPIVPNDGRTHFMGLSIITEASSAPVARSSADYSNTFELKSVTVAPSYEDDPSDIVITFESGKTMHATRASVARRRAVRH